MITLVDQLVESCQCKRQSTMLNPNCIRRDVVISNSYIRLNVNQEERYTSALVRDVIKDRDVVCFLETHEEDINTSIATVYIMQGGHVNLIILKKNVIYHCKCPSYLKKERMTYLY